jgi:hypothetical protein
MGAALAMILQHPETHDLIASRPLKWFGGLIVLGAIAAALERCKDPAFVDRLINVPAPVLLALAVSTCLVLVGGVQRYLHCRFSEQEFVEHNEVGGPTVGVVGTPYAVVLGFLTVETWQHFSDARQLVSQEASAAADIWHTAVGLPPTRRARIRQDVLDYSKLMVDSEWPRMRSGAFDRHGDVIVMDARSNGSMERSPSSRRRNRDWAPSWAELWTKRRPNSQRLFGSKYWRKSCKTNVIAMDHLDRLCAACSH